MGVFQSSALSVSVHYCIHAYIHRILFVFTYKMLFSEAIDRVHVLYINIEGVLFSKAKRVFQDTRIILDLLTA